MKTKLAVTKKQMKVYENIKSSGVVNMWNVGLVCEYSGGILNREDCVHIMANYEYILGHYGLKGEIV